MRVFLAEPNPRYDISTAESFGTVQYLLPNGCNPFDMAGTSFQLIAALESIKFNPKQDYICMTGNTLTIAMLLSIVSNLNDVVRLLVFDARRSAYIEKVFSLVTTEKV